MTEPERAFTGALLWMTTGSAAAIPALVLPEPSAPLTPFIVHLGLIVVFSIGLAFHLAPTADEPWFVDLEMGVVGRRALTWVGVVVLATGATGLVTLATSAALRYDPSLQFLQLLSALDIAWVVTAVALGLRRRFGDRVAAAGSAALGLVCVWSIWRYLDAVGFTGAGGWKLSAIELRRYVLPFDTMAAIVAIVVFSVGVRQSRVDS